MALYLDTEFNGFGGALISIALVSSRNTDDEFYAVRHLPTKIVPWVAEHVVPFLVADAMEDWQIRGKLVAYLRRHSDETIFADWPEDFVHLMMLLCEPGGIRTDLELSMRLIAVEGVAPAIPHNALSDARALMAQHATKTYGQRTKGLTP
jgi:hypothetical protein